MAAWVPCVPWYDSSAQNTVSPGYPPEPGSTADQRITEYPGYGTSQSTTVNYSTAFDTSTLRTVLPGSTTAEDERKVDQFMKEFLEHLKNELSDGARRSHIKGWIRSHLSSASHADDTVINEALQAVAATSATFLQHSFSYELTKEIDVAIKAPWRYQLARTTLKTEEEYQVFLNVFVTQNLYQFYNTEDQKVNEVACNAARRVREKTKISHRLIPGLAKLALYDFVFLCDNSGSMQEEDRIMALRDTLQRVSGFATLLSSEGISIRILNHYGDHDGRWDNLSSVESVSRRMDEVSYNGSTPLGTRLWEKILYPLVIGKAHSNTLKKPVVVIVITDGEANSEEPTALRDNIFGSIEQMRKLGYTDASLVFLISRVGTSEVARVFVEGLGNDTYIGHAVYVSPADLQLKRAAFQDSGNDIGYTELLIQLFLAALQVRTNSAPGAPTPSSEPKTEKHASTGSSTHAARRDNLD